MNTTSKSPAVFLLVCAVLLSSGCRDHSLEESRKNVALAEIEKARMPVEIMQAGDLKEVARYQLHIAELCVKHAGKGDIALQRCLSGARYAAQLAAGQAKPGQSRDEWLQLVDKVAMIKNIVRRHISPVSYFNTHLDQTDSEIYHRLFLAEWYLAVCAYPTERGQVFANSDVDVAPELKEHLNYLEKELKKRGLLD